MQLSPKQKEFWNKPFHRWCIKHGATRSGKTYLDYFMIPRRIRERAGMSGLVTLLGNTKGTLQRNVIEPMQQIYGVNLVSNIRADNTAIIFGEKVYCLGADNKKHVDRIRGSSIKYCYGDEITTWNEEVFTMLKSRLDKPYSCFDGTCNPLGKTNWVYKFLQSDADIFSQSYSLDDNQFLDERVRGELKREHTGVFYDRYIRGLWVSAEGAIYKVFSDNKYSYYTDTPDYDFIQIGIDFGGNNSAHSFTSSGLKWDCSKLTALASEKVKATDTTPEHLYNCFERFLNFVVPKYGEIQCVFCDSAEQVLINGLRKRFPDISFRNAIKHEIIDRIRLTTSLMAGGKFFITKDCKSLESAFEDALYDDKSLTDERLDDGTSDIDSLDSFEYSWENFLKQYARS
ncbi:MAG: phage terminase large subunit [Lachnospiraceae bacterium]|nr:phage terminase large subunit [Lachnospiraceae bacterium]